MVFGLVSFTSCSDVDAESCFANCPIAIHQVRISQPFPIVDCGWDDIRLDPTPQLVAIGPTQQSAELAFAVHGDWFGTADEITIGCGPGESARLGGLRKTLWVASEAYTGGRQLVLIEPDGVALALGFAFAIHLRLMGDVSQAVRATKWLAPDANLIEIDFELMLMGFREAEPSLPLFDGSFQGAIGT